MDGAGTSADRPGHERARVLVHHVVRAQRDEQHRADPERVPPPLERPEPVGRQGVPGQVRREPLRPVAELDLVVARHRHPRPVRGRGLVVVAEVPPYLRLRRRVQVRVAEVAVQQVEQRLELLHRADRVRGLAVGQDPVGVRGGEVAEAGEPERGPPLGRGAEHRAERVRAVPVIVGGDRVAVGRAGAQPVHPRVVRPHGLAVEPVGVAALLGRDDPLPDPHPGPRRTAGRRPRDHHAPGRVVAPGEVDLLRCAIVRAAARRAPRGTRVIWHDETLPCAGERLVTTGKVVVPVLNEYSERARGDSR